MHRVGQSLDRVTPPLPILRVVSCQNGAYTTALADTRARGLGSPPTPRAKGRCATAAGFDGVVTIRWRR